MLSEISAKQIPTNSATAPNEVAGSSNLRQDERDGASFRSRRHAFEYELSRRHVALLGRVDHRAHHVLDVVLHQLLGQHGGTVTGGPGPTSRVAGLPGLELSAGSTPPLLFLCIFNHHRSHTSGPPAAAAGPTERHDGASSQSFPP